MSLYINLQSIRVTGVDQTVLVRSFQRTSDEKLTQFTTVPYFDIIKEAWEDQELFDLSF